MSEVNGKMKYNEFIEELKDIIAQSSELFDEKKRDQNPKFREWRHNASDLIKLIRSEGYDVNTQLDNRRFDIRMGYGNDPTVKECVQQYNQDLQDSINEFNTIVDRFNKYGAPKKKKTVKSTSGLNLWEKITGLLFGLIFVSVLLAINVLIAEPTPSQHATFKTILALAAAGIGGILAGTLYVEGTLQKLSVRAGGALALFVLVYFFSPAPPNAIKEPSDVTQEIEDSGTGIIHTGEGDINTGR